MGKTYYISTIGDDKNNGSFGAPFRTIQKGANIAQAGDTVLVKEGVYRERVSPPRGGLEGLPIVYMGETDKNVIIKGSDQWKPSFQKYAGNIFYAVPKESMFNDDCYVDNKNPFKVPVSSTPYGRDGKPEVERGYGGDPNLVFTIGQVYVDGMMYMQKGYLSELNLSAKTWFYNPKNGAIYIHFEDENPSNHEVEISTRRRIFAPHKRQLGYIVVKGFVMEHCGNQYPANFWEAKHPECQQAGAIGTRSGHHWVIKNNVIRFANGVGIDFGNEGNSSTDLEKGANGLATGSNYHIIDSNYITDNGGSGTAAFYPSCITFSNNVVERNNNLHFTGKKRWESAGVKMHGPNNSIISNNLIRSNFGKWGLWLDQGSGNGTRVHGNLIIGNEVGFDLEIGSSYADKMIFDNNILINNKTALGSRESGGITAMHNLIIGSGDCGIHNTINKIRAGSWSSENQHYFNNILLNNKIHVDICSPDFYRSADRQFDYNIYDAESSEKKFGILGSSPESFDFSSWQDKWESYNNGQNCDLNGLVTKGISYQFNESSLKLMMNIDLDAHDLNSIPNPQLGKDYLGNNIPDNGTAIPGPFQDLKEGRIEIKLWKGLAPLSEYQMPH